jgi:polysaccharide export outer membrane protein
MKDGYAMVRWHMALFALVLTAAMPQCAFAQSNPTSAQLEAFRNLPPGQQQAVLEAVGGRQAGAQQDSQLSTPLTSRSLQRSPADEGPPRIGQRSTLLLAVTLKNEAGADDAHTVMVERRERVLEGNPYHLDAEGRITLPIVPPINLSGLTDAQAGQLLDADPRLAGLNFAVTLLPLKAEGVQALRPFGYDVFDEVPTTFAPATDIPVPVDYRVGPGDNITVDLFGKKIGHYLLVIDRNGALTVPEFGPIQVTGLSFDEVRSEIEQRVATQMIGVRASVTMGQLRSIRIFMVGDVARAGSYTVSGLSTITNALFASGGVAKNGSLRNIELKRGGQTVVKFDLYDLLLNGDTSKDRQLQPGDAIFIPTIGSTAGIAGQVQRPAIYELRGAATVGELLELSGGLKPDAEPRLARLERVDHDRERIVLNLDLSKGKDRNQNLLAGDLLTIPQVLEETREVVLQGHVQRPGAHAWWEGMRLTNLLGSLQTFKINADQRYLLIRREHATTRKVEVLSADAERAFEARGTDADPLLESRDRVIVFGRESDRGGALTAVIQELQLQMRDNSPMPAVWVQGRVRAPGQYPLEENMTVADLLRAGGGLDDAAYLAKAELTRYEVINGESRKTEVIELDLNSSVANASDAGMSLRSYDVLTVKATPDWREQEFINLRGEVRFPGKYPIRAGETLKSVIERAGGLTPAAAPKGSIFMREELKQQEREQVENLANRLQSDLALVALQNAQSPKDENSEALAAGQALLAQVRGAKPTGRLVIDLERALAKQDSNDNIALRGGDELAVPRLKPYVTVVGEVQNGTSHVWRPDLSRDDYIQLSGGTTLRADTKRTYIVRANGSVLAGKGARWFGIGAELEPGDTIVVPIDAERTKPLTVWTAATTIVYNMAVAVAAIGSL